MNRTSLCSIFSWKINGLGRSSRLDLLDHWVFALDLARLEGLTMFPRERPENDRFRFMPLKKLHRVHGICSLEEFTMCSGERFPPASARDQIVPDLMNSYAWTAESSQVID